MSAESGGARRVVAVAAVVAVLATVGVAGWTFLQGDESTFEVDGAVIKTPDGHPFIPTGMNLLGPDAFFNPDGVTAGQAEAVARSWKANTVRLNSCLAKGCPYTGVHNEHNDDLDGLVAEYTSEGLVVMIALHQIEPGQWPDDDELDELEEWWRDVARRFKGNTHVWFNVVNEPGNDKPASKRWLELHRRLVGAIRDEGADNIVVVDGTSWGQEAGGDHGQTVQEKNSAILTFGPTLAEEFDDVVFSFHVYNQWGNLELTDKQRVDRMRDFVQRIRDEELAVIIGEVGGERRDCCERESLATFAAYEVAAELDLGLLVWHGQSVDDHRLVDWEAEHTEPDDIDDPNDPTNLTWQGELLWRLTRLPGRGRA